MAKVDCVHIENFRSIRNQSLHLNEITAFVGYNNAGKTNFLRAIEWLLKPASKLSEENFGSLGQDVVVVGKISDISIEQWEKIEKKHQAKIEKFFVDNSIWVKRIASLGGDHKVDTFLAPGNQSLDKATFEKNPTGISNALAGLMPEMVHISAMFDALTDTTKQKAGTTFSQLVTIALSAYAESFEKKTRANFDNINEYFRKNEAITEVSAGISKAFDQFFPGSSAAIGFAPIGVEDVLAKAQIQMRGEAEGEIRPAEAYGQGLQRSAQMALIKYLADSNFGKENKKGVVLLIDEPELYLHPQMIAEISRSLVKMTKGEESGFQVLMTTHSPMIIRNEDVIKNTYLVRKKHGVTSVLQRQDNLEEIFSKHKTQYDIAVNLENLSYSLFSETVLIAEGETEKILLPQILKDLGEIDDRKLTVVMASSCFNIPGLKQVLRALGMRTIAVHDFDAMPNLPYGKLTGWGEFSTALEEFRQAKNYSAGPLGAKKIAVFIQDPANIKKAESLRTSLKDEGTWVWKNGDIEAVLYGEAIGASLKTQKAHDLLSAVKGKDWYQVIDKEGGDKDELKAFVDWVKHSIA